MFFSCVTFLVVCMLEFELKLFDEDCELGVFLCEEADFVYGAKWFCLVVVFLDHHIEYDATLEIAVAMEQLGDFGLVAHHLLAYEFGAHLYREGVTCHAGGLEGVAESRIEGFQMGDEAVPIVRNLLLCVGVVEYYRLLLFVLPSVTSHNIAYGAAKDGL